MREAKLGEWVSRGDGVGKWVEWGRIGVVDAFW